MIEIFRDVLDGPLYIVITILSIIFIMAIIGFLMERKKLEKEAKDKIAVVNIPNSVVPPIEAVSIEKEVPTPIMIDDAEVVSNNQISSNDDVDFSNQVKPNVIVFEDPDQKKE